MTLSLPLQARGDKELVALIEWTLSVADWDETTRPATRREELALGSGAYTPTPGLSEASDSDIDSLPLALLLGIGTGVGAGSTWLFWQGTGDIIVLILGLCATVSIALGLYAFIKADFSVLFLQFKSALDRISNGRR